MYKIRRIFKRKDTSQYEIRDLLEFMFLGELISPGKKIFIVSPWISNIPVLNNSLGQFSYLDPNWPKSEIRLKEVLIRLMTLGQEIFIVYLEKQKCRDENEYNYTRIFLNELEETASNYGVSNKLNIKKELNLHTKGLLTDSNFISGSMNFTYNGLNLWDESVIFETLENEIIEMNFMEYFINNDRN